MRMYLALAAIVLTLASCANARVKGGTGKTTGTYDDTSGISEKNKGAESGADDKDAQRDSKAHRAVRYELKVVKEYPHSPASYTQGLFFHEGRLYESAGGYGESAFMEVDLETGEAVRRFELKDKYFAEGAVIFEGTLYILTWENGLVFLYDPQTLRYRKSCYFPHEGWGLTTDGKMLIASDGSSKIYFMDSECKIKKSIEVTLNGRALNELNELEYIDGKIWANVYTSDMIVIIDPKTGVVDATVDCTGLLPDSLRGPETDVLNGIAYNPANGKIYLTGKRWKRLYEIELREK